MDVRCERCNTDYDFDQARIPSAGAMVQCTQCQHVFRVSRSIPPRPTTAVYGVELPVPPPSPSPLVPPSDRPREWRVRQPNGSIFPLRELTTLQRWIVERKVTRNDEITHTGDAWKRLGDIPDLAAFFQVVDEAQRASQREPLQLQAPLHPTPIPPGLAAPQFAAREPAFTQGAPSFEGILGPPADPGEEVTAPPVRRLVSYPRPQRDLPPEKSGARWVVPLVILLLLGGAAYAYHQGWIPLDRAASQLRAPPAAPPLSVAQVTPPAPLPESADVAPQTPTLPIAEKVTVAAPRVEKRAVATPAVEGETDPEGEAAGKQPAAAASDLGFFMAQGDRFRRKGRAESALESYAKAAALAPDRPEPIAGQGLATLDLGRKQEAIPLFEKALSLKPSYAAAVMGLAEAYRALDSKDEALKWYQRYVELAPDGPQVEAAKAAIQELNP